MNEYALIIDPARKRDFTADMVMKYAPRIEKREHPVLSRKDRVVNFYEVNHLEKYQKLRYEDIAHRAAEIMDHSLLRNNCDLVVDGTGVGEALINELKRLGLLPNVIIFTPSGQVRWVYNTIGNVFPNATGKLAACQTLDEIHVPKEDLVAAGRLALEQGRLSVANVKHADDFKNQLMDYKGPKNDKGNRQYNAEHEAVHDDFVSCFIMGSWWFMNRKDSDVIPERELTEQQAVGYDPLDY